MNIRRFRFRVWDTQRQQYAGPAGLRREEDPEYGLPYVCVEAFSDFSRIPESTWQTRFILEQWTSLTDSKGKEVYEGDILGFYSEVDSDDLPIPNADYPFSWWERAVVKWYPEFARFGLEFYSPYGGEGYTGREQHIDQYVSDGACVIGNVHENGELLT